MRIIQIAKETRAFVESDSKTLAKKCTEHLLARLACRQSQQKISCVPLTTYLCLTPNRLGLMNRISELTTSFINFFS